MISNREDKTVSMCAGVGAALLGSPSAAAEGAEDEAALLKSNAVLCRTGSDWKRLAFSYIVKSSSNATAASQKVFFMTTPLMATSSVCGGQAAVFCNEAEP